MKKKTHSEYVLELFNKNPNIEVLGEYVGANNNIPHKCKICGHEWSPKPSLVLCGFECPECNKKKMTKTQEQYINELYSKNPKLNVIGKYVNCHTKILHQCNVCKYEWFVQPAELLRGNGCPRCANHLKLTQDDFVNRMKEIHPTIQVIGEYKGSNYPVKVQCLNDGWIWEPLATNLIHNHKGCPKCNLSHGELQIERYLCYLNIAFIPQHSFPECKNKKPLHFDFYLPDYNMCIEYDGIQHFEPNEHFGGEDEFLCMQINDQIKNDYCLLNSIVLCRINYKQDVKSELDKLFNSTKLIKEAI